MKRLTTIVALVALTALGACKREPLNDAELGVRIPRDYLHMSCYEEQQKNGEIADLLPLNTWAIDLDHDDLVDEVLQVRAVYPGAFSPIPHINLLRQIPTGDWNHYVAPGYENKSYVRTQHTRPLDKQSRATLNKAYLFAKRMRVR